MSNALAREIFLATGASGITARINVSIYRDLSSNGRSRIWFNDAR